MVYGSEKGRKCLDIFSHGDSEGAALDLYSCYGPGEDNQRWNYDPKIGTIKSFQDGGNDLSPFVITTCRRGNT